MHWFSVMEYWALFALLAFIIVLLHKAELPTFVFVHDAGDGCFVAESTVSVNGS